MKMTHRSNAPRFAAVLLACVSLFAASLPATPGGDDKQEAQLNIPVQTIWPAPPDLPRIRWVAQYAKFDDFSGKSAKKRSIFERLAGAPSKETEQRKELASPYGIAKDSKNRLFVADGIAGGVVVFDEETKKVEVWGPESGLAMGMPIGVAVDGKDRVFVSDSALHLIFCLSPEGKVLMQFGREELQKPTGLAVDRQRNLLYVADVGLHRVSIFNLDDLSIVKRIGGPKPGSLPGQFRSPLALAVDSSGFLYVVDTFNHRIQVFNRTWRFERAFGDHGDGPGMFSRPKGIAVDSEKHVYVTDAEFNNFQIFDSQGRVLLYVGTQGVRPGQFTLLAGLCIDAQDRIYTTEQRVRPRVQVFQFISQPETANRKEVHSNP